jgi:hypothetical protein
MIHHTVFPIKWIMIDKSSKNLPPFSSRRALLHLTKSLTHNLNKDQAVVTNHLISSNGSIVQGGWKVPQITAVETIRNAESHHFGQELLAVGPFDAGDAQEVGVERLVKHLRVIPLKQERTTRRRRRSATTRNRTIELKSSGCGAVPASTPTTLPLLDGKARAVDPRNGAGGRHWGRGATHLCEGVHEAGAEGARRGPRVEHHRRLRLRRRCHSPSLFSPPPVRWEIFFSFWLAPFD